MKHILIILLLITGLTGCLNKRKQDADNKSLNKNQQTFDGDSVIYLSKTNNKIELLKPNYPKFEYLTKEESKGRYLDGVYIKDSNLISLKDGELIIYNRFFEIDEKLTFKDNLIILREYFILGKISIIESNFYQDSIYVTKFFYDNGSARLTRIRKPNNVTEEFLWHQKGKLATHSIRRQLVAICDFWTEDGYFEQRQRYTYANVNSDMTISQEIIDRENKLLKKIQ